MSELDKKLQKNPLDLIQSVLDAVEKRSVERTDVLVSNALRQLKTSRFKPDQTITLSLTYLARVCPKAFQSVNIREQLKTHIKRDSPANIKGGSKNDFILPVLAANILLACCDSAEVRSILLTRIEQWIATNQKLNEMILHLLAVLCTKCNNDPQTIKTLIEIRGHWYQFLDINYATYGQVSRDLSQSLRELLSKSNTCESISENLYFLMKHDSDITGLSTSISQLVTRQPITMSSMFDHPEHGDQLKRMIIELYNKLFENLNTTNKDEEQVYRIYINIYPETAKIVGLERDTLEAILILASSPNMSDQFDVPGPLNRWLHEQHSSPNQLAYEDVACTKPLEIPTRLLHSMIRSNDLMVELALKCATSVQLLEIIQSLGISIETLHRIFKKLGNLDASDVNKSGIRDLSFFSELFEFYDENGLKEAGRIMELVSSPQDVKDVEMKPDIVVKIKSEPV